MTTHVVSQRWTAEEALEFLRSVMETLDAKTLQEEVVLGIPSLVYDYWGKLPPELSDKWAPYRTPPLSRFSLFMGWLFEFDMLCAIVVYVRRILQV